MLVPVRHLREAAAAAAGNPLVAALELPAGAHVGYGIVDPQGTLQLLAAFFGLLRAG
jgi:hypothetical protein